MRSHPKGCDIVKQKKQKKYRRQAAALLIHNNTDAREQTQTHNHITSTGKHLKDVDKEGYRPKTGQCHRLKKRDRMCWANGEERERGG
jgi:hypothetical protein